MSSQQFSVSVGFNVAFYKRKILREKMIFFHSRDAPAPHIPFMIDLTVVKAAILCELG